MTTIYHSERVIIVLGMCCNRVGALVLYSYTHNPGRQMDRFTFNDVDGRYCIVLSGAGPNDPAMIRERLKTARIAWDNQSDELCLELFKPTVTQAMSARQICNELNQSKRDGS